jgi:hypothetical protein
MTADIAAFAFNLYESRGAHHMELIGAASFDEEDPDWACDDVFMSPDRFALPHTVVGKGWEEGQAGAEELIRKYLESSRPGAEILKSGEAVAVGFVDGDLSVVWKR